MSEPRVSEPKRAGNPGARLLKPANVSVRDIARRADVSPASVSRAINDPSKVSRFMLQRIWAAIDGLEASAQPEAVGTPAIGCLFLDQTTGPRFAGYDATIWAGIARVAMDHNTEVHLLNPNLRRRGESLGAWCRRREIGGLAIRLDDQSVGALDELASLGIPATVIAHRHEREDFGYVCVRSRSVSREAVEFLISLGHTRIAFARNLVPTYDHGERHIGYVEALEQRGLERRPEYELSIPADVSGGMTAISRLLALRDPPTAVYFADPAPTVGALRALHDRGVRVPEQFSVIGFDDDELRSFASPPYTSVCQDAPDVARIAGQSLVRAMALGANAVPAKIEVDGYLEINHTTGPVPSV